MNNDSISEIRDFIARVVGEGSAYRIEAMEKLYTPDQSLLFLNREGRVVRASRAEMIAEFTARRDAGDRPLSTEYRVLHIEHQEDTAVVLLYRRMHKESPPFLYELRLRKETGAWQVSGETVTPWPDLESTGAFLPPRQSERRV